MFDEETESAFDLFADMLVAYISDFRLEFFEGCTVAVAPVGAPPEWITCMVDGVNDPNIYWRGVPTALIVGDEVLIWHNPLTHRREILAASGATGVSGGVHNLLSATHPDTTPAGVVRGDLVGGLIGPTWGRVALGTTGFFLKSDGADFNWMRISAQTCVVGPGGTDETTTLGGAVAIVNAAGPPTAANPWVIIVRGMVTAEAGNVTIPQYCHVVGTGEGSTIGMGANTLYMSDDSSLLDLVVTGSDTATIEINNADCILRNVRAVNDGSGSYVVYVYGDSDCKLYDVVVEATGSVFYGIYLSNTVNVLLDHCIANDPTNFTLAALGLANSALTCTTRYCKFAGDTDDVWTGAASTWIYLNDDFDYENCTVNGTAEPADGQPVVWFPYTVTVTGDFATIQDAVDHFKGRTIVGACKIDVDAGAYNEAVVFENIYCTGDGDLELEGDTRVLAGLTYIDNIAGNRKGLANGGSGTMSLSRGGAGNTVLTVTGSTTNPDFDADGWAPGDRVLVFEVGVGVTVVTLTGVLNNTLTQAAAWPAAIGNEGSSFTLIPDRSVARTSAGPCVKVVACQGVKLDGWYLDTHTGDDCHGLWVRSGGQCICENVAIRAEDYGFYCEEAGSIIVANDGACSAVECAWGFFTIYSNYIDASYSAAVECTGGYFCARFGCIVADYAIQSHCTYGFFSYHFSHLKAVYAISTYGTTYGYYATYMASMDANTATARNCGTGYYSAYNSWLNALNTNANNFGNVTNYSPAASDTEGNVDAIITWS